MVTRVMELLRKVGKQPAEVADRAGFVSNRLQMALLREALAIVAEGQTTREDLDTIVRSTFGFRLPFYGPFQIADMAGLDTYVGVFKTLERDVGPEFAPPDELREHVEAGRLGTKAGEGFSTYSDEERDTPAARARPPVRLPGEVARIGRSRRLRSPPTAGMRDQRERGQDRGERLMSDSATVTREDAGKDVPVKKLAIASTIGTIIEAYDFVLYGTVAALVFDKLFFPDAAPVVATLAAFATFGVGFLARPVGGVIFGHYGDKVGRKKMLVLALVIMGVATVLIGALPGYDSIGIWAPILLVTLRLIQGAALGGEWGGAVLMVTEYAPKGKRGFYGSWPQIGFAGGLAISTALIWIMSTSLSDAAFESWGWRVPFFASALLVAVGLWIRLKIEETPAFTELQEKQEREKAPAVEVFRDHKKPVLRAMGMRFSENITFYMLIVFGLSYGEDELGISRDTLLAAIIICAVGSCIVIPMWGALTDRVGRRPVFLWGAVASVFLAAAFFPLLHTGSALIIILLFVIVMNTAHDAQYATESSYFSEMFPTQHPLQRHLDQRAARRRVRRRLRAPDRDRAAGPQRHLARVGLLRRHVLGLRGRRVPLA